MKIVIRSKVLNDNLMLTDAKDWDNCTQNEKSFCQIIKRIRWSETKRLFSPQVLKDKLVIEFSMSTT